MRVSKPSKALTAPPRPACAVCTTPRRCGTPAMNEVKGPHCAGKANGPDLCDCLHECGEIGAGMLASLVDEARALVGQAEGGAS